MREDVKKFLFIGAEEDKEAFFRRAQVQGIIHFIDPSPVSHQETPPDVQRLTAAIRILRGLPSQEQEENFSNLHADAIVDDILRLHENIERLAEDLRVLAIELARIEIFGDFSLEDVAYIEKEGKCRIRFFAARPDLFQDEPEPEGLIFITSEHGLDYYMAVNGHSPVLEKMFEVKFTHSLSELKHRYQQAEKEHRQIEQKLKDYVKYNDFLHHALIEKLNQYHLYHAQTYVQEAMGGSLFAVEGWVPVNKEAELDSIIGPLTVYVEEIAIEPTDVIPTYLENHGAARLGEDLVHIYDTPSSTDEDPSMWVLSFFTLFFAFIIGDAGYGLLYLTIALFLRYKYPDLNGLKKRILDLFTVLSTGCVVWGVLMTSFFGLQIGIDNPLRKLSLSQWLAEKKVAYHLVHQDEVHQDWIEKFPDLKDVKDVHQFVSYAPHSDPDKGYVILNDLTDNIMFELALFIGVVHLILSLGRYARRNWHQIGWIAFLIGAYLYFPAYLKTPSILNFVGGIDLIKGGKVGLELMIAGIGIAWLLAIIRHGWTGIFEIVVLIQVFADTLSYLRLYALALAGAIVASTINEIASGMPLIIGVILILLSHFINIILDTMSGVIHGLRLNFLEWYHYSFEGGGKRFQPLKLLEKE